jgi:hypothetical protein
VTITAINKQKNWLFGSAFDEESEVYRQFPKVYEVYQIYQSLSPSVYFWVHVLSGMQ